MAGWNPDRTPRPVSARLPQLVADNPGHDQQLSRVVELEIIPRLLMMHTGLGAAPAETPDLLISPSHVATLAELAIDEDADSASRFVQALVRAGATAEQVYLELLAPCARLMGSWWCDDLFNFSQVTIGLWRLQQVLQEQGRALRPLLRPGAPRALLAAPPGSQHCFGAAMAAELFAQAGWDVRYAPGLSWELLGEQLAAEPHVMLGLSIGSDREIPSIASAIVTLRQRSCTPALRVLLGGPMAATHADLAQRCGADAQVSDVRQALSLAAGWSGDELMVS